MNFINKDRTTKVYVPVHPWNLKETSESQGICLKSQGKVREFCCLKFIYSQVEDPNFENFLGELAPRPS